MNVFQKYTEASAYLMCVRTSRDDDEKRHFHNGSNPEAPTTSSDDENIPCRGP